MIQSTNFIGATPCSAGGVHSLFLEPNGAMKGMGDNSFGELGTGTTNEIHSPGFLQTSGVIAIAAGIDLSFFITSDNSLYAMGANDGLLGDGSTAFRYSPVKIDTNVVAVATGGWASFFLKSDGSLWATGFNSDGEFGNGLYTGSLVPVRITYYGVAAVAAGGSTTYIIGTDGILYGAGDGEFAQLGDGFDIVEPLFNQIYPRPPITINRVQVVNQTNLSVIATCGVYGNYALVSAPKLTTPFDQWVPVWTNVPHFNGPGNCTFTATNVAGKVPFRFFMLKQL